MKKFIIAFAAVLIFVSTTAFTGKEDNPAALTLQREFKGAESIIWSEGKDVIAASFILSNSRVIAYFNYSGELLSTLRNVLFNQLPLTVIKEVNNRFGQAPVYDITEYTSGPDTFYTMLVDTPTRHLKVKVSLAGDISIMKKSKK